jgi:hypothetical protein
MAASPPFPPLSQMAPVLTLQLTPRLVLSSLCLSCKRTLKQAATHLYPSPLLHFHLTSSSGNFVVDDSSNRPVAPNFHVLMAEARRCKLSVLFSVICCFRSSPRRRVAREREAEYGHKSQPQRLRAHRQQLDEVPIPSRIRCGFSTVCLLHAWSHAAPAVDAVYSSIQRVQPE